MKYIRTHIVDAEPMKFGEFKEKFPKSGGANVERDANDDGYVITYRKGEPNEYVSWCPQAEFDTVSRPVDGMTFGMAIEAICSVKKIARAGWGEGEFVRAEEMLTFEDGILHMNEDNKVPLCSSMCCVYHWFDKKSNEPLLRAGWTPSFDDIIAVDWKIVE